LVGRKKTLHAAERDEAVRAAFRARLHTRPADAFVVVDECSSKLNLTPRYARAPRTRRAYGRIPRAALATTTIIVSLHLQGMGPTMALPGAADAPAFEAYVRDVLAPTLRPGQIVLLDNARIHLSPRIAQIITAHGCELWFLPSSSPDSSPIADAFAELKHQWRQAEARTPDALLDALGRSLPSISAQDAHGFFRTCGFRMETNQVQCF
jgi:transposase